MTTLKQYLAVMALMLCGVTMTQAISSGYGIRQKVSDILNPNAAAQKKEAARKFQQEEEKRAEQRQEDLRVDKLTRR